MELWKTPEGAEKPFAKYATDTAAELSRYRWRIPGESDKERAFRIGLISPQEWALAPGCDGAVPEGILLVHGLTDSPFLMRDLGDFFSKMSSRCFRVRSILLPGHGTTPGDLLHVTAEQWKEALNYGLRSFGNAVSAIHIVGFSTGGTLALAAVLAGHSPGPPIRSVILLSPAIQIPGLAARLYLVPALYAWMAGFWSKLEWLDVDPDQDYAKYESFNVNAAYQIIRLTHELSRELDAGPSRLSVPILMALAVDDQTVSVEGALDFFDHRAGELSRLVLYVRHIDQSTYKRRYGDRARLVEASDPGLHIREFSHLALPVALGNPHYGEAGDYKNCLHYLEGGSRAKYCSCLPATQQPTGFCPTRYAGAATIEYGEKTDANLRSDAFLLRRLTYNPHLADLLQEIRVFLESIEPHSGSLVSRSTIARSAR